MVFLELQNEAKGARREDYNKILKRKIDGDTINNT